MKTFSLLFLTLFSFAPITYAQTVDVRIGASLGQTKMGQDSTGDNGYSFSANSFNADIVSYVGRVGFGGRYSYMDTIGNYKHNQNQTTTQSYQTVSASTVKMFNSSLSAILTYRFHTNEFMGDLQIDKVRARKVPSKTFGDFVLTYGRSDKFRMIMTDSSNRDAVYTSGDVTNYSGSFLMGWQTLSMQLGLELGYREILVSGATTTANHIEDKSGNFRVGYPFFGFSGGFGF